MKEVLQELRHLRFVDSHQGTSCNTLQITLTIISKRLMAMERSMAWEFLHASPTKIELSLVIPRINVTAKDVADVRHINIVPII